MTYTSINGLVHAVVCEHYDHHGHGERSVRLDLRCGGRSHLRDDVSWRSLSDVVTCFGCIAAEARP